MAVTLAREAVSGGGEKEEENEKAAAARHRMALENFGGERDPRLGRRLPRPRSRDRYFEKEPPGLAPAVPAGPRDPLRAQPAPLTRARPASRSRTRETFKRVWGVGGVVWRRGGWGRRNFCSSDFPHFLLCLRIGRPSFPFFLRCSLRNSGPAAGGREGNLQFF